jgi:hypothetical protein
VFVLTLPYGKAGTDDVQRTYDDSALDALIKEWRVEDRTIAVQDDGGMWTVSDEVAARQAVAMLVMRPPADN